MTVGQTIRALRKKQGLAQAELGSLCGLSAAAVCAYERGRSQPKRKVLEKFAAALDVPVSRLTTESASKSAEKLDCEGILAVLKQLYGAAEETVLLDGYGNQLHYFTLGRDRRVLLEQDAAALAQAAKAALISAAEWVEPRRKLG